MSEGWQWPPGCKAIRKQVFRVKGRRCFWCGAPAGTVDHYPVPAALGGPAELWNLIPACRKCNYSHGASFGNAMRPGRPPLTTSQRRAVALKRRGLYAPAEAERWRSSRRW
jgi:5-methylcytosine-specific restriction endonuclease McrA